MFARPTHSAATRHRLSRMMKFGLGPILGTLALVVFSVAAGAQSANVNLLTNVDSYSYHSDIWGYTSPGGTEIAIIGTGNGTSFVDVTNTAAPSEVLFVPGGTSTWRDMKTYGAYAYIVDDEAGDGLVIVDMTNPASPSHVASLTNTFFFAHNVYIDEAAGLLIACGDGNSTYIMDVAANQTNPPLIATLNGVYLHDVYARDGVLYGCAIFDGTLNTYDISSLPSISLLDTIATDNTFCHNVWLSDDGNYAFATDEVSGGHITVVDVSDPSNMVRVGGYEHPTDTSVIIHNVTVEGNYAYVAWYKNGLEVIDIAYPAFPSRVGYYDTFPGGGSGYDGQWGVYPFAQSGNVYCSDMSTGLYVFDFQPNFGRVIGTVTDQAASPLEGVTVRVAGLGLEVRTDANGFYKFSLDPGAYTIEYSLFGYGDETEPANVSVLNDTTVDAQLTLLPSGSISGTVRDANTLGALANADVEVLGTPLKTTADGSGNYTFPTVPQGSYTVRAAAFGYGAIEAAAQRLRG